MCSCGYRLCGRRWQAQYSEPSSGFYGARCRRRAMATVCLAGAVLRAFRRDCGAPQLPSARQAQYSEPSEGVAARGVAAGPRLRSAGVAFRSGCGAPLGRGYGLQAWQVQYSEPSDSESVAAPGVATGPRLRSVWQAQYSEPSEGFAARGVAAGPRLCLCGRRSTTQSRRWAAATICVAGAGRHSTQSLQKGLRRADAQPVRIIYRFVWGSTLRKYLARPF